jgi:hypothetical protein
MNSIVFGMEAPLVIERTWRVEDYYAISRQKCGAAEYRKKLIPCLIAPKGRERPVGPELTRPYSHCAWPNCRRIDGCREEVLMSDRASWKMLHLLYTLKPGIPGLTAQQLGAAGVDCGPDTIQPLVDGKAVVVNAAGIYSLGEAARKILQCCVVTNRRWSGKDMLVDHPEVFVVMPFQEAWSTPVYEKMIRPSIEDIQFNGFKLTCVRGDAPPRVGDLTQTIWSALMRAGLVIADVSVPNPNVFYEIGLTHALGKDCFILKQKNVGVPADFGGSHYYEYDLADLNAGRENLQREITTWSSENRVDGVHNIDKL